MTSLSNGSVVWAKSDDWPWWPALIVPHEMTLFLQRREDAPANIPGSYLVEFFNDGRLAMLEPRHVAPFDGSMRRLREAPPQHAGAIRVAVAAALEWITVCGTPAMPSPIVHVPERRRAYEKAVRRRERRDVRARLNGEVARREGALAEVRGELQEMERELLTLRILL